MQSLVFLSPSSRSRSPQFHRCRCTLDIAPQPLSLPPPKVLSRICYKYYNTSLLSRLPQACLLQCVSHASPPPPSATRGPGALREESPILPRQDIAITLGGPTATWE